MGAVDEFAKPTKSPTYRNVLQKQNNFIFPRQTQSHLKKYNNISIKKSYQDINKLEQKLIIFSLCYKYIHKNHKTHKEKVRLKQPLKFAHYSILLITNNQIY